MNYHPTSVSFTIGIWSGEKKNGDISGGRGS